MSNPESVDAAAKELSKKVSALHLLYLNAGLASHDGYNFYELFLALCTPFYGVVQFLTTGRAAIDRPHFLRQLKGQRTRDGSCGLLFATHVMGHTRLVERLRPLLARSAAVKAKGRGKGKGRRGKPRPSQSFGPGRVIWTGSSAASPVRFDFSDIECITPGSACYDDPYGGTKCECERA